MSSSFKSTTRRFVSPLPQLRETRAPADPYMNSGTPSATRESSLTSFSSPAFCTRDTNSAAHSIILPWDQSPVQIPNEEKLTLSAKAASILKDVSDQENNLLRRCPESESSTQKALPQKAVIGFQNLAPAFDDSVLRSSTIGCIFSTDDPQLHLDDSGRQVCGALTDQRELVSSPVASSTNEEWRRIEEDLVEAELNVIEAQSELSVAIATRASIDQSFEIFELQETGLAPIQSLSSHCQERKRESLGSVHPDNAVSMPSAMNFVPLVELKLPLIPALAMLYVREDWTWSTWLALIGLVLTGQTSAQALGLHALHPSPPMPQGLQPGMILHGYVAELKRAGLVPRAVSSPVARDVLMQVLLASGEGNFAGLMMQVAHLLGHKTKEIFRTLLNRT